MDSAKGPCAQVKGKVAGGEERPGASRRVIRLDVRRKNDQYVPWGWGLGPGNTALLV